LPPRDFSPDEEHDAGQPRTDWQPPGQRHANQRENAPDEGLVGQATEAMRNVAESASDLVQDTYETGARYAREGWDSLPEVDRYSRAVSRPVEQGPDDNGVGNHGGLAWVEGGTFPMPPERLKTGSVRRLMPRQQGWLTRCIEQRRTRPGCLCTHCRLGRKE